LTLDKPADYELLQRVHEQPFDGFLPATAAIDEMDDYNLASVNESVSQRRARRD
jgi:hypothetical protein